MSALELLRRVLSSREFVIVKIDEDQLCIFDSARASAVLSVAILVLLEGIGWNRLARLVAVFSLLRAELWLMYVST